MSKRLSLCCIAQLFPETVILPLLYKVLVRPHLEYCNVVWHPRFKRETEMLECVQRRATKMVQSLKHHSYEDRLQCLKLPSLYYRRARGDMIECYKYLTEIYKTEDELLELDKSSNTRGHCLKLKKLAASRASRANFFSRRITNAWNRLPSGVVTAPSLNSFKNRLDKHWQDYWYCLNIDWFV